MTRLNEEIREIATRVRRQDYLWAAGMSLGICIIFAALTRISTLEAFAIWLAILASLAVRFYLSTSVDWSAPVRALIGQEMQAYQRLRSVMNALPSPVMLLDQEFLVEMANPAADAFAGIAVEGKHISEIIRAPAIRTTLQESAVTRMAGQVEITLPGKTERMMLAHVSPILGLAELEQDPNSAKRFVLVLVDMTQERRVEKMRSDFIANASHELRTPLASMLGFIETLRGHAKDDPVAREKFLDIMQKQAERMQRLVRDLMSLSAIELNENLPPTDAVQLDDLVKEVIETLKPVIEENHAQVAVEILTTIRPVALGHRDQVYQVIQNLIDNGVKYSSENPIIKVRIGRGEPPPLSEKNNPRSGDTAARIAVAAGLKVSDLLYLQFCDNGVGIKREDLPRLTERFYRVDAETSRQRGGTGLGLAIVKHIMNRHRGGFQIESGEGTGAAFTCFFLPVKKP